MWEFDSGLVDLPAALRLLAEELGAAGITPGVNCRGTFCSPSRPPVPTGEPQRFCNTQSCILAASLIAF